MQGFQRSALGFPLASCTDAAPFFKLISDLEKRKRIYAADPASFFGIPAYVSVA
jgi:hypothetical protein